MKDGTRTAYMERILRVLLFIQDHLDDPLSLDELAEAACLSPYHFHRVFRGMVGEAVKEHIRRLRLERSAHQLTGTRWSITRIAFNAGYETHESFTRAFRSMFDESPSQFRKKRGWANRRDVPSGIRYSPGVEGIGFIPIDSGGRFMEAEIKRMDSRQVVFIRHVGPYDQCRVAWVKLCAWAEAKGLLERDTTAIGLCHDDPEVTPLNKIRYDACLVVPNKTGPEGEIGRQEIPSGDYAVTVHHGPFERLKDTYAKLCGQWIPERGREIRAAPSCEICLNDPNVTPPENLMVEIQVPLESILEFF